jgi:hypothetical protein
MADDPTEEPEMSKRPTSTGRRQPGVATPIADADLEQVQGGATQPTATSIKDGTSNTLSILPHIEQDNLLER